MDVSNRAYAMIEVKNLNDSRRTFSGWATTPEVDRVNDSIDPFGAKFTNPLVLLHQHRSDAPIGSVTFGKPTSKGIPFDAEIPVINEPGPLKDRCDTAWGEVKNKLVRAVSIGFRALKYAYKENGGIDFQEVEIYELSTVSVPANAGAMITDVRSVKQFDIGAPAATGHLRSAGDVSPPGATGSSTLNIQLPTGKGTTKMTTIAELQEKRKSNFLRIEEIDASANGRTKTAEERTEFKTLRSEIEALDVEIDEKQFVENAKVGAAKPVKGGNSQEGTESRSFVPAVAKSKEEPGIDFARLVKVKMVSRLDIVPMDQVAKQMYGQDSKTYQTIIKANEVVPGSAIAGTWGVDLISPEGAASADFVEWLRSQTILGKFGTGGIPALHRIGFYEPYVIQTADGVGYWVGEAKPVPLTSFDFDRSTMTPLKMGNIAVLTERNIRYSSPQSDILIRDQLTKVLVATEDTAFIDPANSGTSTIKPASITNGAETIVATGTGDADDVRLDFRALMKKFTDAHNPPRSGVFIMSSDNAVALGTMVNALGQPEFTGIGLDGGKFMMLPVIVSDYAGTNVVLVNASDIYYGDEGGVEVDISREASLEMRNTGLTMDGAAGTGFASVSMFQTNMVAVRAMKTVNWKLRRTSAVAYLTSAAWGGAVPAS